MRLWEACEACKYRYAAGKPLPLLPALSELPCHACIVDEAPTMFTLVNPLMLTWRWLKKNVKGLRK